MNYFAHKPHHNCHGPVLFSKRVLASPIYVTLRDQSPESRWIEKLQKSACNLSNHRGNPSSYPKAREGITSRAQAPPPGRPHCERGNPSKPDELKPRRCSLFRNTSENPPISTFGSSHRPIDYFSLLKEET
uniref:Uncharacterized protein n=1 Tax=Compsopogon caeruleus TaxID=31354 RepID=A0A7S1XB80_9RHOD